MAGAARTAVFVVGLVLTAWVAARLFLPVEFAAAVGMLDAEAAVLPPVLQVGVPLAVWECLVGIAAVLDWRDARLVTVGWRQAWAVAHVTLLVRLFRRAQWAVTGLRLAATRAQDRRRDRLAVRATRREYIQLDPTEPFHGKVIDAERDEDAA